MTTDETSREDLEEQLAVVRQALVEITQQLKMRESERDLLAVMLHEAVNSQARPRDKSGLDSHLRVVGEFETSGKNPPAEAYLLESIPAGIVVLTQSGIIKSVNRRFLTMTGYSSFELIGNKINVLYEQDETDRNASDFISSAYSGMKRTLIRKDGTTFVAATAVNRQTRHKQVVFCIVNLTESFDPGP
jgi:PAS domain S-box-containing protein